MLLLLQAAEEAAEPSKTPFYVFASLLVLFALGLATIGTLQHETFPPSRGLQRGIILLGVLLVAGTMATAIITA
jgi:hypothetical protein